MQKPVAIIITVLAIVSAYLLQDDPWRLGSVGYPADQLALAHRDSPYTHVTWAASAGDNGFELRFFDKVEGGVCLQPDWPAYKDFTGLDHIQMPEGYPGAQGEPGPDWPANTPQPNPGTLTHTRYISLYPMAILLNDHLIKEAGGDWRNAAPKVLIVGLGSGVGVSIIAHHFPHASITVVDIDQVVIDMVRERYPLLRWLEQDAPKTRLGKKRLNLIKRDARQYILYNELREDKDPYDLVILDAYTAGSTIPPHLMTAEFYKETSECMHPEGLMLSNIIGSYTGEKRRLLGGAMRSMYAGGWEHVHNFPIVYDGKHKEMDDSAGRNNMVLAAHKGLMDKDRPEAWKRLQAFIDNEEMYKELPTGRYLSDNVTLYNLPPGSSGQGWHSSKIPLSTLSKAEGFDSLKQRLNAAFLKALPGGEGEGQRTATLLQADSQLLSDLQRAVKASYPNGIPHGWDSADSSHLKLHYERIDWVKFPRRFMKNSVAVAGSKTGRAYNHDARRLVGGGTDADVAENGGDILIRDAPLFTDSKPNADIVNND